LEGWKILVHDVQLLVCLSPFQVIKPVSGVWNDVNLSTWTSKEESPFSHVDLVVSEQNLGTEKEGEKKLVTLEERSTDVVVKRKGEVVIEILDSLWNIIGLDRVLHTISKQPLEPLQRVLIHRINDSKINDTEEQK